MFSAIIVKQRGPMPGRNGQELLGTWVSAGVAAQFKAYARGTEGGASAELRRMVTRAVDGKEAGPPAGVAGHKIMLRLKSRERLALLEAAQARGTTPTNWLRSLALAHLTRQPQWNEGELQALRDVFVELRRIGNNVNQIARALNVAAHKGEQPPGQGEAARDAVKEISRELRRVGGMVAGNLAYWGASSEAAQQKPRRPRSRSQVHGS